MNSIKLLFFTALFGAGLTLNLSVNAQSSPWKKKQNPDKKMIYDKLNIKAAPHSYPSSALGQQQRPTGTQSRMTSFVRFENDGVAFIPEDSIATHWVGHHNNPDVAANVISYLFSSAYPDFIVNRYKVLTASKLASLVISAGYYKEILGDSTNVIYSYDDGASVYEEDAKIEMTLNANGDLLSFIEQEHNGTSWENLYKVVFTYDGQSRITNIVRQDWNGSVFENNVKDVYDYDSQGRLSQFAEMQWDNGASVYNNSSKSNVTYDAQDRVVEILSQQWNGAIWVNDSRMSLTFISGSSTEINQGWDGLAWANDWKATTTFDTQDNPLVYTSWNWNSGIWEESWKDILSYDVSSNLTSYIEQSWNGGSFANIDRYTYNYNVGNKVTDVLYEEYNDVSNSFDTLDKVTYTLNTYNQYTSILAARWNGTAWPPAGEGEMKTIFHYEEVDDGTAIQDVLAANDFSFFPNPAHDQLNLRMNNSKLITGISITDISGRVVYKNKSQLKASELSIPVNNLTDGVYFLQINSEGQKGARSFVVKH